MRITNLHAHRVQQGLHRQKQVYIRINLNEQLITKERLCTLSQHLGSSEA